MPKAYEAMRDKFASRGMSYDNAQTKAAKIYNSMHPGSPVGRRSDSPTSAAKKKQRKNITSI